MNESGYDRFQAEEIGRDHAIGAAGLKVLKTLGLYLRENITSGALISIDDPRFDPMWEACGGFGIPVAIQVSGPDRGSRAHLALAKDTPTPRVVQGPEAGEIVEIPQVGGLPIATKARCVTDGRLDLPFPYLENCNLPRAGRALVSARTRPAR